MCPTRGCRRLGQGSASERWNAIFEFLLKYQHQVGGGQAPEPPAVGRLLNNTSHAGETMISRKDVHEVIDDAEKEYCIAWNTIRAMKLAGQEAITIEILLALQPAVATGIYHLAKIYHDLAAEKRSYISRKKKLNSTWFKNRLRLISDYQNAIHIAISIGKSLGDAFAWFFYYDERELLLEHGKHEKIPIPPIGVGGKGELAIAKNIQVVDGHIFLHHGITNILRFGDISIISLSDMSIVAIAEIKTRSKGSKILDISMNLASVNKDKLEKFTNAITNQSSSGKEPLEILPKKIRKHLDHQLNHIGKMLNRPKAKRNEKIELESNIHDISRLFEDQRYVSVAVHKVGRSQVVIRTDLPQAKLADRILNGPNPLIIQKAQGLVEATIETTVEDKSLNRLYIGEPYNPSPKTHANPSIVPMVWWPLDLRIPKALIFHETVVFSVFNAGPFLWEIQKLGFEIIAKGHSYSAKKQLGDNVVYLENLQFYFDLIVLGFTPEDSLIKIISRLLEAYKKGEIPIDTHVNLAIIQHIFD